MAQAVGVSYNAPYKHFKNRNALLAAVVADDFAMLSDTFREIRRSTATPLEKFKQALTAFVEYSQQNPARYRLMANNPDIAEQGSDVDQAGFATFGEFSALVDECRAAGDLPDIPGPAIPGLIFAALHGLINLDANGRLKPEKGLNTISQSMDLLLSLLSPKR